MNFNCISPEDAIPESRVPKCFDERMRALIERLKFPDELPEHADYKKPYLILFNGITDALDSMERMNFGRAKDILQDAQINAEEAYLSAGEEKSD